MSKKITTFKIPENFPHADLIVDISKILNKVDSGTSLKILMFITAITLSAEPDKKLRKEGLEAFYALVAEILGVINDHEGVAVH